MAEQAATRGILWQRLEPVRWWDLATKRTVDVVLALGALIVLLPVLLVAMLAVGATSRGPVIFRQERLGRGGRPFTMLKLRTMRTGTDDAIHRAYVKYLLTADAPTADGSRGLFKLERDPRITPVGAFLRRSSLDELPQLINVVLGQMSIVGPRPVLAWEAEFFDEYERVRFDVRPGLTGLWQVSGRNRLSMRDALRLDVEYVRRRSFVMDVWIIVKTLPALLGRESS